MSANPYPAARVALADLDKYAQCTRLQNLQFKAMLRMLKATRRMQQVVYSSDSYQSQQKRMLRAQRLFFTAERRILSLMEDAR